MAYEIIPMSTGYNPQYTANKQGFGHWPPGFFKRCLSAKKHVHKHTPLGCPCFYQHDFKQTSWMIRGKTGKQVCQLPATPKKSWKFGFPIYFPSCLTHMWVYKFGDSSFHLLSLTTTPNSHEMQGICPPCAYQTGVSCLWYLEIHRARSTLQVALLQKTTAHNRYIEKLITKYCRKVLWRMGNLIRNNPPKK